MDILTESQLILLETEKKKLFPLITLFLYITKYVTLLVFTELLISHILLVSKLPSSTAFSYYILF